MASTQMIISVLSAWFETRLYVLHSPAIFIIYLLPVFVASLLLNGVVRFLIDDFWIQWYWLWFLTKQIEIFVLYLLAITIFDSDFTCTVWEVDLQHNSDSQKSSHIARYEWSLSCNPCMHLAVFSEPFPHTISYICVPDNNLANINAWVSIHFKFNITFQFLTVLDSIVYFMCNVIHS